jgi:hypothetical protein
MYFTSSSNDKMHWEGRLVREIFGREKLSREYVLFGVEAVGTGQSSGFPSQASLNRERAASVTERSSDLGMNMLILVLRFSTKVVVFSIAAAVDSRFRDAILVGIRYAFPC